MAWEEEIPWLRHLLGWVLTSVASGKQPKKHQGLCKGSNDKKALELENLGERPVSVRPHSSSAGKIKRKEEE